MGANQNVMFLFLQMAGLTWGYFVINNMTTTLTQKIKITILVVLPTLTWVILTLKGIP